MRKGKPRCGAHGGKRKERTGVGRLAGPVGRSLAQTGGAPSAVVKNDTAVRAALAAYYSGNKEGVQQAADKAANEPAPESAITLALAQTAAIQ